MGLNSVLTELSTLTTVHVLAWAKKVSVPSFDLQRLGCINRPSGIKWWLFTAQINLCFLGFSRTKNKQNKQFSRCCCGLQWDLLKYRISWEINVKGIFPVWEQLAECRQVCFLWGHLWDRDRNRKDRGGSVGTFSTLFLNPLLFSLKHLISWLTDIRMISWIMIFLFFVTFSLLPLFNSITSTLCLTVSVVPKYSLSLTSLHYAMIPLTVGCGISRWEEISQTDLL